MKYLDNILAVKWQFFGSAVVSGVVAYTGIPIFLPGKVKLYHQLYKGLDPVDIDDASLKVASDVSNYLQS